MDSFLTACGALGPLTIEVEGPGLRGADRRAYAQPFVLVGRDDRADLLLDHDLVSRRHAYLQLIEGRLFFVDLDSRAGTFLGDNPSEAGWLAPGQELVIGPYTVRRVLPPEPEPEPAAAGAVTAADPGSGSDVVISPFASAGEDGLPMNPLLARSSEATELPRVTLEFQSRTAGHSVWRMSQALALVGSSPRCKVRLLDSNVSKLHCALMRTARGLWVVDLLGRGGITVNGVSVRSAPLGAGDVLGLGEVIVRPNFEGAPGRETWPAVAPGAWGHPGPPARPWGGPPAPAEPGAQPPPYLQPARFATDPPPAPAVPPLAGGEPALGLLLNHFGQMQQQMLDQFQQSMMMMFQMFNGMHREQMGMQREQMDLVRAELDRLRELNNEVQAIKAQMADRPPSPPPPPGPGPWSAYARDPAGRPAPPLPAPPGAPNGANPFAARPQPRPVAPPGPPPAAPGSPTPLPPPGVEAHDWLNDRLTAITQEQQSRWQKIMGILRGGP